MSEGDPIHISFFLEGNDDGAALWSYWSESPAIPRIGEHVYYWMDKGCDAAERFNADVLARGERSRGRYKVVGVEYEYRDMYYVTPKMHCGVVVTVVKDTPND